MAMTTTLDVGTMIEAAETGHILVILVVLVKIQTNTTMVVTGLPPATTKTMDGEASADIDPVQAIVIMVNANVPSCRMG